MASLMAGGPLGPGGPGSRARALRAEVAVLFALSVIDETVVSVDACLVVPPPHPARPKAIVARVGTRRLRDRECERSTSSVEVEEVVAES